MKIAERSLSRRLTLSLVVLLGALLPALSFAFYTAFTRAVWHQFDMRLERDALAIALMVEEHEKGPWEIEEGSFERFEQARGPNSFQIWMHDGSPLARVPASADPLPLPAVGSTPAFTDVTLSGDRPGRLYQAWLQPRWQEGQRATGRQVAVAVTRDAGKVLATISTIRRMLWVFTVAVVALAALVAALAVRGSLAGVKRLSENIAGLDSSSLDGRLELRDIPSELRPPFEKVNELLARIEASFARERQLTADASHELRTPIAGLHTLLEVTSSRERPAAQYRAALGEALEIVKQMESTVEGLLTLARVRQDQASMKREEIALRDLAEYCFAPYAQSARDRKLRFENRIPPDLRLSSDREKLQIVISNLLSNATEYTAEGGWIAIDSDPARQVLISVRDSGPPIPEHSLGTIFDAFVRLDDSRSGGGKHWGIGLALVHAVCEALGHRVTARNEPAGAVVFTVSTGEEKDAGATFNAPWPPERALAGESRAS